jgi:hypothetical protein
MEAFVTLGEYFGIFAAPPYAFCIDEELKPMDCRV